MLTVDTLTAYGADVKTGLRRCANKEVLYFRLIKTVPGNKGFEKLPEAIAAGNYEAAFEAAHGLKGITSNLSLDSLSGPLTQITEHLRSRDEMDYQPLLKEIEKKRAELSAICSE